MSEKQDTNRGEVILYEAPDRVDVRLERETVWLSQAQMAELFGRERSVVTKHDRRLAERGLGEIERAVGLLAWTPTFHATTACREVGERCGRRVAKC
ncbi:MAG: hypothetical protein WD226_08135 [Planctomycetota bacterium]